MSIRVLRLARPSALVTAQVFEELFDRELGALFEVRRAPLDHWCASVLGDDPASAGAARTLGDALREIDFFSPSYEGTALVPLLVSLRNRARSRARLLLIAHSPALLPMEWALLPALLAAGDVIVTPSEQARSTILFLAPSLEPWVHAVPHPISALPGVARVRASAPRLVSLGRLHPDKLVHRQISAMALLRARGHRNLRFDIAGTASDSYSRVLAAQIDRLALGDTVRMVGQVTGGDAKAEFLSGAAALLNLSTTLEESFGKAPAEALAVGLPVVVSRWNGLPETIGSCGAIAPVSLAAQGAVVDVSASAIADAIEALLTAPPSADQCREQSRRFSPEVVRARYGEILAASLDAAHVSVPSEAMPDAGTPAASSGGLLRALAPLTHLTWRELFAASVESATWIRATWRGEERPPSLGDRLRSAIVAGSRVPLERFFARLPAVEIPSVSVASSTANRHERTLGEAMHAALSTGAVCTSAVLTSRVACLLELRSGGHTDAAWHALDAIEREGHRAPGLTFLHIEAIDEQGDSEGAFARAIDAWRTSPPEELEAHRVRQLARLARRCGRPAEALPWLATWLERNALAVDAGAVWLDRCAAALRAGDAAMELGFDVDDALTSLSQARMLLGANEPAIRSAERALEQRHAQLMVA